MLCTSPSAFTQFYIYDKFTCEVLMVKAEEAKRVAPLRLREGTGYEVLMFTHEEE